MRKTPPMRLFLGGLLAAMLTALTALPAMAAERPPLSSFGAEPFQMSAAAKTAYDAQYRVPVQGVTTTGGQYSSSAVRYAIDGNVNTHWETGRPNSTAYTNELVFTFAQSEHLGSLVYYPRVGTKGFPTAYSIYASPSTSGNDFTLVYSGTASVTGGGTRITFAPTDFVRLKFVFDKAAENWAAAGEVEFYRPDTLPAEVTALYTDGTMSELSPEYRDPAVFAALKERVSAYPDPALMQLLDPAERILSGEDCAAQVFELEQRGDMWTYARSVLKTTYGDNLLPTGYAATTGQTVTIYVDVEPGAPLPGVVITQQVGSWSNWSRSYTLRQGYNTITMPRIYDNTWSQKPVAGGAIYLTNPYTADQQGRAPKVRIEGATDYPLYRKGDNAADFLAEVRAYQAKLKAEPTTTVDVVELLGEHILLNGNVEAAIRAYGNGRDPIEVVNIHDKFQVQMWDYSGVTEADMKNVRVDIRLMQPYGAGYAANGHIGTQQDWINSFFQGGNGWGYFHEIGHELDVGGGTIGEVTNNMWSNYMSTVIQPGNDRCSYNSAFLKASSYQYATIMDKTAILTTFWQLHTLDENYWPKYQQAYRDGVAGKEGLNTNERIAVVSSYVLGTDVVEHFERYRLMERSDKVDAALAKLGVSAPGKDFKPWYLWTKAEKDRTSAFTQDYTVTIKSVELQGQELCVALDIDPSAQQALLGYEVLEDGKVLGFTKSGSFITPYFNNDGQSHTYTARAYDLRLNATAPSAPAVKNLHTPKLTVAGETVLGLNATFDPSTLVRATTWDQQPLDNQLELVSGRVDTTRRGVYPLTYSVEHEGLRAELTVDVTVVSATTYLSDMKEQSFKVGWSTLRKDTGINGTVITLLRDGQPVTFRKGLGAHAHSEIVYDLTGKDYQRFEALVGIDQNVKNQSPRASFQVWVDGELRYESGPMLVSDNAKAVSVSLEGAKTLRLVGDSLGDDSYDHTVWADARLVADNTKPVLTASDLAFTDPTQVDFDAIAAQATAWDLEDGDLSAAVTCETDYVPGLTGTFSITYSVTDSDGNTVSLTRNLAVVNDFVYVSDVDWVRATVGWRTIQKDRSLAGNALTLRGENGTETYEKGIGTHAWSEITYDLTDKGYLGFASYVGVDQTVGNSISSVIFRIYVDNKLVAESPLMRADSPALLMTANLAGAKTLRLVVSDGGNGNGNDHANWADARFLIARPNVDRTPLREVAAKARELDSRMYTEESWAVLTAALEQVDALVEQSIVSPEESQAAIDALEEAIAALALRVDTAQLRQALAFAEGITSIDFVNPAYTHRETRFANIAPAVADMRPALTSPEYTQAQVDDMVHTLIHLIEETGQVYVPGSAPVVLTAPAAEETVSV